MKDIRHLIRAGILALLVIIIFTVIRFITLPPSWGKYGHYRANAVAEEMAETSVYQGHQTCKICHNQKKGAYLGYEDWSSGKHALVNCETCHGAGNKHIEKSSQKKETIEIDSSKELCLKCHLQLADRPGSTETFPQPQIDLEKHMGKGGLSCLKCHNPHHPDLKLKEEAKPEPAKQELAKKEEAKPEPVKQEVAKEKPTISKVGQSIYNDKCLVCHGSDGKGKTEASEFLTPKPPDFSDPSYKASFNQIVSDTRNGKGDAMPAYKDELTEEEIKEVAKYIRGFKK